MKGVSKYGQFKVRSNTTNQSTNNENKSSNIGMADNTKLATKITIRDGKVRAPLAARISENVTSQQQQQQSLNCNKKEEFVRLPLQNLTKPSAHKTITAATFFRERHVVQDKFEIYRDDENEEEQNENSILNVSSESSIAAGATTFREQCSSAMSIQQDNLSEIFNATNSSIGSPVKASVRDEDVESEYMSVKTSFSDEDAFNKTVLQLSDAEYEPSSMDCCPAYIDDIFIYEIYREKKLCDLIRKNYMEKQAQVDAKMRLILIEWLTDVCVEYNLSESTFYLVVSIMDRVLSNVECPRPKFQLVGATCIFVAGKSEEIHPPLLNDIIFITNKQYTKSDVFAMERIVLSVIDFNINVPLAYSFSNYYLVFKPLSKKSGNRINYFLRLSALHYEFIRFLPSRIGAACYALGLYLNNKKAFKLRTEPKIEKNYTKADTSSVEIADAQKEVLNAILRVCWPDELLNKTNILREEILEPFYCLGYYENLQFSTSVLT